MYRTNLKINISTNVSGTDGEDLVCNIFDELMMRLSEFIDGKVDIFDFKMNERFFVKSKESLIEKLPKIERKLSENLDLTETLSDDFEFDTGYCDDLHIRIDYEEYNMKTLSRKAGTYAIKFTKSEDFDVIVKFYDVNVFDTDSDIDIAEVALHRHSGQNTEEKLSDNSVPLTPENLIAYCHYEDALSPRYVAEHLKEFYPNIPEDLEKYTVEVLTECDEPEEIAFDLSDIFDRIERTDLYNDLSKYK